MPLEHSTADKATNSAPRGSHLSSCRLGGREARPTGILRPSDRDVAGHRRHIADENASSLEMLFLPRGHVTGKLMDGHEV